MDFNAIHVEVLAGHHDHTQYYRLSRGGSKQFNCVAEFVLVEVNVAHRCVEVLVARESLEHASVDALISKLCEELAAPVV